MNNLNIRIFNYSAQTCQVIIYHTYITPDTKENSVGAWVNRYLAPDARFYTTLPSEVQISAIKFLDGVRVESKRVAAELDSCWEVFSNNKGIDIREYTKEQPLLGTIDIYNHDEEITNILISKDNKPVSMYEVPSGSMASYISSHKLFVGINSASNQGEFVHPETIIKSTPINYEGQEYLTVILEMSQHTGQIETRYSFGSFTLVGIEI